MLKNAETIPQKSGQHCFWWRSSGRGSYELPSGLV